VNPDRDSQTEVNEDEDIAIGGGKTLIKLIRVIKKCRRSSRHRGGEQEENPTGILHLPRLHRRQLEQGRRRHRLRLGRLTLITLINRVINPLMIE